MLMPIMCTQCAEDLVTGAGSIPEGGLELETKVVPVQTVGLYRTVCGQGHHVVMVADFQQFELLFESALEAFTDTYFREAVSSFAAALERYYEFAVRTLLVEQGVSVEKMIVSWKSVAKQSERQLGMFVGLYTAAYGAPPKILSNDEVSFRNNVIHNGHFPTVNEAFEFGQTVYKLLYEGVKELRTHFHDSMQEARDITRQRAYAGLKVGEQPVQFAMGTTISLLVLGEPLPMLDAINAVAERLGRQRASSIPKKKS